MGVKEYKPMTPGQRGQILDDFEEITTGKPEKSLLKRLRSKAGRTSSGRITARHRGGGNKRFYRIIDFKRRDKDSILAEVASIEYDPYRSAHIALLNYQDGEKRYILAPLGIKVGDQISSGPEAEITVGSCLPLRKIPLGTVIHNVELSVGRGGQLGRSAGTLIQLVAKEGNYAVLKLPSGEQRMVHLDCRATIGQVGNLDAKNVSLGKAGRKRWLGRRPHVRGVAMNPCDHPHGGGEGKAPIGRDKPVSPWGKPALGKKTRKPRKRSNRFILARRR